MMRATILLGIRPVVKPPTAAKGDAALALLKGARLLLSPHHKAIEG